MAEQMPLPQPPQIKDKRPSIRSLLPENMQARVLGGIALLMTLIILFSGRKAVPTKPAVRTPATETVDANAGRIQEYRAGLDAATRQLAEEEAQLAQTKAALGEAPMPSAPVRSLGTPALPTYPSVGEPIQESRTPHRVGDQSLFSSNIALSYRPAPETARAEKAAAQNPAEPVKEATEKTDVSLLNEPSGSYRLLEGTVLETVLVNRLDSSFSGPVNCQVTTDVYSSDHSVLLVPRGSRVLGEVRKVESQGDQRLAVLFHRLVRPDGYSVSLDKFQGLSQIGETGLVDEINHHYLQIFGAAIAIGSIAGLAQANTSYGTSESAGDAYRQGVSSSLSQSALHILDRYLNVLPTFTIREGHRVKVYLSQDLEMPAYDPQRTF